MAEAAIAVVGGKHSVRSFSSPFASLTLPLRFKHGGAVPQQLSATLKDSHWLSLHMASGQGEVNAGLALRAADTYMKIYIQKINVRRRVE